MLNATQEFDGPAVTSIGAFEDIYSRFESKFGRLMRLWPVYLFTPWVQVRKSSLLSPQPHTTCSASHMLHSSMQASIFSPCSSPTPINFIFIENSNALYNNHPPTHHVYPAQDSLQAANPATLRYCNLSERGLIVLHLTRRRCHAEFHYVGRVTRPQYKNYCEAAYYAEVGERGRLHKGSRYLTVDGVLPKRTRRKRAGLIQGIHDVYKGPS